MVLFNIQWRRSIWILKTKSEDELIFDILWESKVLNSFLYAFRMEIEMNEIED